MGTVEHKPGHNGEPGRNDKPRPQSLGERVKQLRLRSGMSQAELAVNAGFSPSYISLIETGQRVPGGDTLKQLARSLRATPAELLGQVPADPMVLEMELGHAQADIESGHARRALRNLDSVLRRYESSISWELESRVRLARATARYRTGDTDRALAEFEELLAETLPPEVRASLLNALSASYLGVGDIARAIDLARRGLDQLQSADAPPSADFVSLSATLASAYRERGDLVSAETVGRLMLEVAARGTSPQTRGEAYRTASLNAEIAGDKRRALTLAAQALGAFGEGEITVQLARMQLAYARILLSIGPERAAEAIRLLTQAHPMLRNVGSAAEVAQCQLQLARGYLALRQPDRAIEVAGVVVSTTEKLPLEAAHVKLILAQARLLTGQPTEALPALRAANDDLAALPVSWPAAQAWRELGDLYMQAGSAEAAVEAYQQALRMAGLPSASGARTGNSLSGNNPDA